MKAIDVNQVKARWPHIAEIQFPEPSGNQIEVLIGLDHCGLMTSYGDVEGKEGDPVARLTPLGWTCIGSFLPSPSGIVTHFTSVHRDNENLRRLMSKYWEYEEPPKREVYTKEEREAVDIVEKSLKKEKDGRYRVKIPWKKDRPKYMNNYREALRRFRSSKKRLDKKPKVKNKYQTVITEHENKRYFRRMKIKHPEHENAWYLSHFPVIREHVATTKLRIVYNAAGEFKGIILNELILPGPKLQQSIIKVLIRFRHRKFAIACDVQQMYLQIYLDEEDQPFMRFLWEDEDGIIIIYQFERVVFGLNVSPFLAQYIARKNAESFLDSLPRAAEVVLESTYMDDGYDSVATEKEGIQLVKDVCTVWEGAKMTCRKWLSNSRAIMESIPQELRAEEVDLTKSDLPGTKSLGQGWKAAVDQLHYVITVMETAVPQTKRAFLKILATIFDPLGLAAPVLIRGKMLLQELWLQGLGWDDYVGDCIQGRIVDWVKDLQGLKEVEMARCLIPFEEPELVYLITCTDACELAYGAVVFIWSRSKAGEVCINLVIAKAKVAPLHVICIPRLELMGGIVGLHLSCEIGDILKIDKEYQLYYSDLMDILYWVRGMSRAFKPFVSHRVGEIQEKSLIENWQHIGTKENPADLLSRGMRVGDFEESEAWRYGPTFLRQDPSEWPRATISVPTQVSEMRKQFVHSMTAVSKKKTKSQKELSVWNLDQIGISVKKYSSLDKLIRVLVYILRFVDVMYGQPTFITCIRAEEIMEVTNGLYRYSQSKSFSEERKLLLQKKELPGKSPLCGLKPWLDEEGIIRASTRLSESLEVPWSMKFPIILEKTDPVSYLLVRRFHENLHHGSVNLVFSQLRSEFWLQGGRELIKQVERNCVVCIKRKASAAQPEMAPLPRFRIDGGTCAFTHISMDFAGPFYTKQGRGRARAKRYLCLATCLHTRGVHLEMVNDMTTAAFLMAFQRIVARRGRPKIVWTDRGSNFIGGKNMLHEFYAILDKDQNRLMSSKTGRGIEWNFNPPLTPHFSGVHEVMIKGAKNAINRIIGAADVSDEELRTTFCMAEELLNSRPLTYQTSDVDDLVPLTPAHFLTGRMSLSLVPEENEDVGDLLRCRWRHVQMLTEHVWRRWMREWIMSLSPRKKWKDSSGEIKKDDVVLLLEQDVPRKRWSMARVLEVYPGPDGVVRVADVKWKGTILRRPAVKLCPLRF